MYGVQFSRAPNSIPYNPITQLGIIVQRLRNVHQIVLVMSMTLVTAFQLARPRFLVRAPAISSSYPLVARPISSCSASLLRSSLRSSVPRDRPPRLVPSSDSFIYRSNPRGGERPSTALVRGKPVSSRSSNANVPSRVRFLDAFCIEMRCSCGLEDDDPIPPPLLLPTPKAPGGKPLWAPLTLPLTGGPVAAG